MKFFRSYSVLTSFIALLTYSSTFGSSVMPITTVFHGKSIILSSYDQGTAPIQVKLIDLQGEVLLSEKIKSKEYVKKYSLENLPDGDYNLEISNKMEIITKKLSIQNNSVSLLQEKKEYKPQFYVKDKICTIALLSFGEKATIIVDDESGDEMSNITYKDKESISKKYDFTTAETGDYNVKVFVGNEVYTQRVSIY